MNGSDYLINPIRKINDLPRKINKQHTAVSIYEIFFIAKTHNLTIHLALQGEEMPFELELNDFIECNKATKTW